MKDPKDPQITLKSHYFFFVLLGIFFFAGGASAQVNTVEFGKNRLQFKKFKWKYYQTQNFNTYFSEGGQDLGKFVCQLAEKELPGLEQFVEYGLQRRANIVIYNTYNDMQQSNIGLSMDWQTTGGITKLVNNKMVIYYDGDHNHLRVQIRQGIARILLENILFGDDLGEFATNQALLDLPQWLTDGYIDYAGETWSTTLDDQLKSAILSGRYKNFYQFAFEKPLLAGHAFWYYMATKYKKENVTYFLYLARVYRNLNNASQRICKKKFKEVLKDFMAEQEDVFDKDIRGRRNFPKGTVAVVEDVNDHKDFFHFSPNPAPRSQTYAVVEFKHGRYSVVLHENFINKKILLRNGVRSDAEQLDPHYPLIAWDNKGTRLACVYWDRGKVKLFVYDVVSKYKRVVQDLSDFQQVQDMKYMLDNNTLLMSASRNGQSDIFVYKIDKDEYRQITNDVYDDLDATFVTFPNKTGIIYSSNRPSGMARSADTVLPSNYHYNVFLVDNWNDMEGKQISQLTYLKYGNARYPTQYNVNHFTFISDENGINNRYAGFFTTKRAGIDTVYKIGDELLHNPDPKDVDSVLKSQNKEQPDTVYSFAITSDSSYIFPITNYQSGLSETKIAGDVGQVTEVRQEGDQKYLYKLKVDEAALKKRNVIARMTDYRKRTVTEAQVQGANILAPRARTARPDTSRRANDFFESEFDKDKRDTSANNRRPTAVSNDANPFSTRPEPREEPLLKKAKLFDYKLKFSVDNFSAGFNNDVLITRYQPFTGSLPINLSGTDQFNGMLKASIFDLFEDIRFTGAMRLPFFGSGSGAGAFAGQGGRSFVPTSSSFFDGSGEWFARVDYLKKLFDFSLLYYRETQVGAYVDTPLAIRIGGMADGGYDAKSYTNLWQAIIKYPFDKVKSLRLSVGLRTDKVQLRPYGPAIAPYSIDSAILELPAQNKQTYGLLRLEYVYDNALMKATNIYNGIRAKAYMDWNMQLNTTPGAGEGKYMYNFGFDARHYLPIYRNFIWAVRFAGDFSWGNRKVVYYLGGTDGWLFPKANNQPQPAPDATYAFQSLAVNLRGFKQNVANGNNALVLNSELRLPVFATLFNKPINNAFLRNFQLVQFFDLGSAWNGAYGGLSRPTLEIPSGDPVPPAALNVRLKAGGIGPFAGGYGFGARSTLLGYFLRFDAGWQMNTFFGGKPVMNVSMGVDF
ncbi:hypothetical protein Q4E93_25105 [Flavitalea sp. BT771]|uniref:hypothetical protein n=1 Tax=Flavitalea sp. BT771 TaxID=3063329 RepID=UPI0026E16A3D|nr:hypothetical protein [Flavitalea sp. BT771]MDO6433910.1 hypothetical protein [Flavitalea sp. BT771]MDV6222185.1 hypothetical protein [Flavitalea sp. BT771]